jgi:phosphatidate cytidylyltransferase
MLKTKNEFYNRLFFSSIAITIAGLLIGFAYHPWVRILVILTVVALTGVGVWEYARLAQAKGIRPAKALMIVVATVVVLSFYAALSYPEWSRLALPVAALGFVSFFIAHFRRCENALLQVAVEFFGVCYLSIPFSFMLAILYPPLGTEDGRFWLFYLIAVTKSTDIGGYFVGKLFGRRPLAPQLSPKKTIEGAIGGFCFAVIFSLFFASMGSLAHSHLSFSDAAWLGALIGVLAQIGDLAESVLKRDALVKDSNSIPGIGGILDMVDSVLLTAPVVYFFIHSL